MKRLYSMAALVVVVALLSACSAQAVRDGGNSTSRPDAGGGRGGEVEITSPSAASSVVTPETTEPPDGGSPDEPEYVTFEDGTLQVGPDVKPGTYRLREPAGFCYWARLKGFSGELDDIIANENIIDAYAVVAISKKDKGFDSNGCGEWSADLSAVTTSKNKLEIDGTYIVKTDLSPGQWKASGGDFCYWARLKGFGGTLAEIIANDNLLGRSALVTIKSTDKGFVTRGCGTWTR